MRLLHKLYFKLILKWVQNEPLRITKNAFIYSINWIYYASKRAEGRIVFQAAGRYEDRHAVGVEPIRGHPRAHAAGSGEGSSWITNMAREHRHLWRSSPRLHSTLVRKQRYYTVAAGGHFDWDGNEDKTVASGGHFVRRRLQRRKMGGWRKEQNGRQHED